MQVRLQSRSRREAIHIIKISNTFTSKKTIICQMSSCVFRVYWSIVGLNIRSAFILLFVSPSLWKFLRRNADGYPYSWHIAQFLAVKKHHVFLMPQGLLRFANSNVYLTCNLQNLVCIKRTFGVHSDQLIRGWAGHWSNPWLKLVRHLNK